MGGYILSVIVLMLAFATGLFAQDREIAFISGPAFQLSDKAIAAGIDGTLTVSFKVDRTGAVKNVNILAGPIWPCDSSPDSAIRDVRRAVKQNILASKFSPKIRNGQPVDGEAVLDFAIGVAYREATEGKPTSSRWVVNVATVGEKALRLPLPIASGIPGVATVRVLIGENGEVISAGTMSGNPRHHASSRLAACDAKFPPTIVDGRPIKVTSLITYEYSRWSVRVR